MINIIGTIFGITGYDIHTRELANALGQITDVKLNVNLPPDWLRYVNDLELEMIKKEGDDEINLIITNPIFWKIHLNAKRNWVFLVWEGDRIPECFVEECLNPKIEYIFCPSTHTISAAILGAELAGIDTSILTKKLKLIPHSVDLKKFYPKHQDREKFKFLCNKGLRNLEDRGGIQYVIKAYLEEFTKDDNVELRIKINPAYGVPNLLLMFPELKKPGHPQITYIFENIPYDKLVEFYNSGDVLVAPSRSEAFGIPMIEAMACGKPVITSNFGGQTDFCNDKNSWLIDGELTEVTWEVPYEGINWLTPNIQKLKKCMRMAYINRELTSGKGHEAFKTAKEYTWNNTAQKIKELI
jgi:glycosyltransferase involved in cell wall biosynthesis